MNQTSINHFSSEIDAPWELVAEPVQTIGVGFWPRVGSYAIDYVVLHLIAFAGGASAALLLIIAETFLSVQPGQMSQPDSRFSVIDLLFFIVYFLLFEWLFGATPGKALLRKRVVRIDGSPCTFGGAFVRSVTRLVDGLFFGAVAALNMRRPLNQRWGDKQARTIVVNTKDPLIQLRRSWWWFVLSLWLSWVVFTIISALLLPAGV